MKEGVLPHRITDEDLEKLPPLERQELLAIDHNLTERLKQGVVPDEKTVKRIKEILSHIQ